MGGVSFFPTILLSSCGVFALRILMGYDVPALRAVYLLPECLFLVCGMTLLYLTGIADDLVGVRYRQKFVIQIICASFFPLAGLWINNFYGLFGLYALPAWIGMPFTVLLVVFVTNAINLIDGIDGLASGLSSVPCLSSASCSCRKNFGRTACSPLPRSVCWSLSFTITSSAVRNVP